MRVTRLVLDHYRSWTHCLIDLEAGVTVLTGHNGLGKTNLVEAVEFLSTGASSRTSTHVPLVKRGEKTATVRVKTVSDAGRTAIYALTIPLRGSVRARVDENPSGYLRDVVGQVPSVSFTPLDQMLVVQDPARRRTFLDMAGTQLIDGYYDLAQRYAHVARQRAALLKHISAERARGGNIGPQLESLEAWTAEFTDTGMALTLARAQVCQTLAAPFARIYEKLSGGGQASIGYAPGFTEMRADERVAPIAAPPDDHEQEILAQVVQAGNVRLAVGHHFQRLYEGEVAQGRNLIGPHRDDMLILLDGVPARDYASNGESWSLAVALKMALFDVLDARGETPILILDDVFAQLDAERRTQIVQAVHSRGQVLITAAAPGDVPDLGADAVRVDMEAVARQSEQESW